MAYLWNHELTNICWPSRLRWRSNWNLFTVACNCSFLVKRFQYIGIFYCFSNFGTILIKRFQYIGIFYCFSNFGTILIKRFQYIGIFYCFSNLGTILIKRFRFYRNLLLFFEFRYYPYYYYYSFFYRTRDWNRKSPKPHHIQPPNSTHIWTLIRYIAVRVSVLIRISVLDLEPNPCFQIFFNISEINHRIFKCSISKRSSG